jgi:hypothetical protein
VAPSASSRSLKSLLVKAAYGKGLGLLNSESNQIDEAGQGALQGKFIFLSLN